MASNNPKAPKQAQSTPKTIPLSQYYYQQTGIPRSGVIPHNPKQRYPVGSASVVYPVPKYVNSVNASSSAGYNTKQIPLPQGQIPAGNKISGAPSRRIIHQTAVPQNPISTNPLPTQGARVIVNRPSPSNVLPVNSPVRPTVPNVQTSSVLPASIERPPTVLNLRDQYQHSYTPPASPAQVTSSDIPRPPTVERLADLAAEGLADLAAPTSVPTSNNLREQFQDIYLGNSPTTSPQQTKGVPLPTKIPGPYAYNIPQSAHSAQASASSVSPARARTSVPRVPTNQSIALKSQASDPSLQSEGDQGRDSDSQSHQSIPDEAYRPRASPSVEPSIGYLKANKCHLQHKIAALEQKIIEETGPKRKALLERQQEAKESCQKAEAIRSGDWRDQAHFLQQQLEVLGSLKKALFQENANLRKESEKQHKAAGLRYFCLRCSSTADIVCLPCRHLACCSNCIDLSNECPKCHAVIEESLQVFVP